MEGVIRTEVDVSYTISHFSFSCPYPERLKVLCGYSAEIHYINRLEKADVLSKISCYHSDFYGTMQFSVYLPDIFLPNKYMFHVKHIATNIYRIRILKLYQKCPR